MSSGLNEGAGASMRAALCLAGTWLLLSSGTVLAATSFSSTAVCSIGNPLVAGANDCAAIDRSSNTGLAANQVLSTSFSSPASETFERGIGALVRSGVGNLGVAVGGSLLGTLPPGQVGYAGGTSIANASYTDTIHVTSSTLAAGTPVVVEFDQTLDFVMLGSKVHAPGSLASNPMSINVQFSATGVDSVELRSCLGDFFQDCTPTWTDGRRQSFSYKFAVNSYVGGSIDISATLSAGTFLSILHVDFASAQYIESLAYLRSLNSAHTFLGTTTAGVSLVAESGHDYASSPVPEPAQVLLMLAGLGVLALRAKARRRLAP